MTRILRALGIAAAIAVAVTLVVRALLARPLPGTIERQIVVGGVPRTYLLHAGGAAARSATTSHGRALVLVLHGLGDSSAGIERVTSGRFDALADREGAVVAYPQALGSPRRWSDG
jgi:poly(3-hydroxybutyrate) depolymerase